LFFSAQDQKHIGELSGLILIYPPPPVSSPSCILPLRFAEGEDSPSYILPLLWRGRIKVGEVSFLRGRIKVGVPFLERGD